MNEFGVFLYESGISLSVLYIFYWFLLRKETYFSLNRIILVSTLLLALIIPFIRITITGFAEQGSIIYIFNRFIMDPLVVSPDTVQAEKTQSISLLWIIYFTGVIFFSLKFLVQFFQIFKLVKKYGTRKLLGYKIVPIDNDLSPFSFFNFIFINPEKIQENELKNVLYHEGEHARRLHTLDIILLEIICIIQWFNPFIWFYKLALREIHEFEADLRVLKNGGNKLNYQQLILQQVFGNQFFQVVHHLLTNSLTKKRITMMTKIESKKRTVIKSLFILPIVAILVMIFSFTRGTEPGDLSGNFTEKELNNTQLIITQDQDTTITEEIFFIVEEMPSFQDKGLDSFKDWAMDHLNYPEEAKEQGIEGTVYVGFVVNKTGSVTNVKIMRGADPLLNAEALRVVESSPKWMPGKQRGDEVSVSLVFPMKFFLQETEKTKPEERVFPVEKKKQAKPVAKEEVTEEIFFIVEEMPSFQGKGLNGFREEWVMKQLEYPEIAAKKGIEGIVYVEFVVNKKGDVTNVKIKRGSDPVLDAEALRVVKSSPQWIPGKQRGQEVNVVFTFPIKFITQ